MHQYLDIKAASEEFGLSKQTVSRIFGEIEKYDKRYGAYSFRGEGKTRQVRYAVMDDYMRWRHWLRNPDSAKYAQSFDVRSAERELGVTSDTKSSIDIDELTRRVLARLSNILAEKS